LQREALAGVVEGDHEARERHAADEAVMEVTAARVLLVSLRERGDDVLQHDVAELEAAHAAHLAHHRAGEPAPKLRGERAGRRAEPRLAAVVEPERVARAE